MSAAEDAYQEMLALLAHAPRFDVQVRPIAWLGAGASMYDGMPSGDQLVLDILAAGRATGGGVPQVKLDRLFGLLDARARRAVMAPLFDHPLKDDSPYRIVVRLLRAGHLGGVVTFNVDDLLWDAIVDADLTREIEVIDAVEMHPDALRERVSSSRQSRPVVLKLHGGLSTGLNRFTSSEIAKYSDEVSDLVGDLSARPAVVCGYSFAHLNVLRAFSAERAALFFCNPDPPSAAALLSLMEARGGIDTRTIDGTLGRFEVLMRRLATDLLGDPP